MHVGTATAAAEQPSSPNARRAARALLQVPGTMLADRIPGNFRNAPAFLVLWGALGGVRCGPLKVVACQVEGEEAAGVDGWRSPCKGRSR